jgi:lysophospholipase L1-like esterase
MKLSTLATLACSVSMMAASAQAQGERAADAILDSMDALSLEAPEKVSVSLVPGRSGQAQRLAFEEGAKSAFVRSRVAGSAAWDAAQGFSFWVKGDGSPHLGGLEVVWNNDYSRRYALAFPIDSVEWKKVTVAWADLVPETSGPRPVIGSPEAPASRLGPLSFGKWWYWNNYTAHSYAIDDIRLEPRVPKVQVPRPTGDPLARVKARLRAGQKVTIVTMGDSLTDLRHWSNRESNWPAMLQARLNERFNSEATLVNPALGGTELRQNLVLLPGWSSHTPAPDLVTVFFGTNDWASGMRGDSFAPALKDAVRRIRRATNGRSDILLLSPTPSLGEPQALQEMADAARAAARSENAAFANVFAAFNRSQGEELAALYAWDKVHLSAKGQEVVAAAVEQLLENTGP